MIVRRRLGRQCVVAVAAVVLTAAGFSAPQAMASVPGEGPSAVPAAGTFYPTGVQRLLGTTTAGYAVQPGRAVSVPVVGREGLPTTGVSAALVNITATAGATGTSLSAFPTGTAATGSTLLTIPAASTRSALLTVPLGTVGGFDLHATGGSAAVTVDIVGFYAADDTVVASQGQSGGYQPTDPARLLEPAAAAVEDARTVRRTGPDDASTAAGQPVAAGARSEIAVDLGGSVNSHVTALALQVTVVDPAQPGALTVWSSAKAPDLSTVSFSAGVPATNLAVVPAELGADGLLDVALTNRSGAPVNAVIDLVGFYDDGQLGPNLRLRPVPPVRILDTASRLGAATLRAGHDETLSVPASVAGDNTFGLVGTVTTVPHGAASTVTLWPHQSTRPAAGSIPAPAGVTSSTPVQLEVGPGNAVTVNSTAETADVALDVTGSFEGYPAVTDPSLKGWVHAVSPWQVSAHQR